MNKYFLIIIICLFNSILVIGQSKTEITIPEFNDDYCQTIKLLESGNTEIDYEKFRESFIESEQFKIASKKSKEFSDLKKEMYSQMSESNYDNVISITKNMLSNDYTNMTAHKILRQTYNIIGDNINSEKYKAIQFGLLKSIINSGDGKSCKTAWSVIQISEEYFILKMLDTKLTRQTIDNNGGVCDKMEVENENGEKATYFFEITNILKGRKKLGIK